MLDSAWVASVAVNGTGTPPTVNTNLTSRGTGGGIISFGDSNAPVTPAGSFSQTWNVQGGADSAIIQVSFAPVQNNTGGMFLVFP